MFGWLTESTYDVVQWIRLLLDFLEDIQHLREEEYSWASMCELLEDYEIDRCPQNIWNTISQTFPDLIDEINDIRIRVYNEGKHPDNDA